VSCCGVTTGAAGVPVAASSAIEQAMSRASARIGQGEHELPSGAPALAAACNSFVCLPVLIFLALEMR
jgi:hypothetical protein